MAQTREFDFLKSTVPSLIQLTAASATAVWLAPHLVTIGAAAVMAAVRGSTVRRAYSLIREEVRS